MAIVFLSNQNISIPDLAKKIRTVGKPIVLITSNRLFDDELRELGSGVAEYHPMEDFFPEAVQDSIDESTFSDLKDQWLADDLALGREYRETICRYRMRHLSSILVERFQVKKVFVAEGLGFRSSFLTGGFEIESLFNLPNKAGMSFARFQFGGKLKGTAKIAWGCRYLVFKNLEKHPLYGSGDRIANRIEGQIIPMSPLERIVLFFRGLWNSTNTQVFVPMHQYFAPSHFKMLIAQDGHLPSNYAKCLLMTYRPTDKMVPSNLFAERWVKKANFPYQLMAGFSDGFMRTPQPTKQIRNVLVVLGHAGDWTANIHRSDTENFILASKELAKKFPDYQFRLRPHPTMRHLEHEGLGSFSRIKEQVKVWELNNLSSIESSLDDDLGWADVIMSEYSQVLIEAWKSGRLGFTYNPTKRKSFMQDFIDLGFPELKELAKFDVLLGGGESILSTQRIAVERYNTMMQDWESFR